MRCGLLPVFLRAHAGTGVEVAYPLCLDGMEALTLAA